VGSDVGVDISRWRVPVDRGNLFQNLELPAIRIARLPLVSRRQGRNAMRLPRRRVLQALAGAAALPFLPASARAQTYPAPVRLIAPFPPIRA
jgi:hypothetical protein